MPLDLARSSPVTLTVTRRFAAPPSRVFAAHVEPDLIRRWMTGPGGWTMPVCVNDARPGGAFRYEWAGAQGGGFAASGSFEAVEPPGAGRPGRIVHVERMHLGPEPTPDAHVTTTFAPDAGGGTLFTMVMRTDDPASMDAIVDSGMPDGLEDSYARIDALEAEAAA